MFRTTFYSHSFFIFDQTLPSCVSTPPREYGSEHIKDFIFIIKDKIENQPITNPELGLRKGIQLIG
jgi:hypothetical protein